MISEQQKKFEAAKKRANEIDSGVASVEPTIKQVEQAVEVERLYNIHKRSLPIGIDKIVYFNVDLQTANMLSEKVLKNKSYHDMQTNMKTLIYYDTIPVDVRPAERNIFK